MVVDCGLRVWCGGEGVVAQFPNQGKMAAGRAQTQRGTCTEARLRREQVRGCVCERVCDGIQEEEDSKGGMDGKERDTRGKCQDLSPCLVFIRAQEARAHTETWESSKEPGGHWAPPTRKPSAAGVGVPTQYLYLC